MTKSMIAAFALFALSGAALADSFDVNSMPLGNIKPALDSGATGSISAKKVLTRVVTRDGASVTQYYTMAEDGSKVVLSEVAN